MDIIKARISNQHLSNSNFKTSKEIVDWLGAVQSQDFNAAKWSLGIRIKDPSNKMVSKAFNEGRILRTHVMRPTWHFVAPENITWMQKLTSERVKQKLNTYNKKLELDGRVFRKTNKIIVNALKNNNYLTRQEIKSVLSKEGINSDTQRLGHIVSWAELDSLIVSGPLKGAQHTYALLEERAPKQKRLNKEESLKELTKLYFQSHGPALIKDFSWWSGLILKESKAGIDLNKPKLVSENVKENAWGQNCA